MILNKPALKLVPALDDGCRNCLPIVASSPSHGIGNESGHLGDPNRIVYLRAKSCPVVLAEEEAFFNSWLLDAQSCMLGQLLDVHR